MMRWLLAALLAFTVFNIHQHEHYVRTTSIRSIGASDVILLWSPFCGANTYLRGDGSCFMPPPTGSGTITNYEDAEP